MFNSKIKGAIITYLVVLVLILSSVGSMAVSSNVDKKDTKASITKNPSIVSIKVSSKSMFPQKILSKNSNLNVLDTSVNNNSGIIAIANSTGDESNPSLIFNDNKALIAYEHYNDNKTSVYLKTSEDYGKSWSDIYNIPDSMNLSSPALAIRPNTNKGFGTLISDKNNSGVIYDMEFNNIISSSSWKFYEIDWTDISSTDGVFWNFSSPDIVYYNETGKNIPYIIAMIGSSNIPGGECKNSPVFMYRDPVNKNKYWVAWDPWVQNCSNISISMDYRSDKLVGVCEIQNGSKSDLLFFRDNPTEWNDEEPSYLNNKTISYENESFIHPKITVKDDKIYIIAESHTNNSSGLVLLTSSDKGKTWEKSQVIVDNSIPSPSFSYSSQHLNVTFFDESMDMDGSIERWYWDFGDGNVSMYQNPEHTYANPGTYRVNLTVWDDDNGNDTISKEITITNTTPAANFTCTPVKPEIKQNITFNSTSRAYLGRVIINHTWNFGDGTGPFYTGNKTNITHNYSANGSYVVNLTVIDNKSEVGYIEKTIYVGLVADFTFDDKFYSIYEPVNFTDLSSAPMNHTITNYTWSFGDGTTSTLQNPHHNYTKPGYYKVQLTIKDNHSNTDSTSKIVKIRTNEFIPTYPDIYIDNTQIYITYILSQNLMIISSNDQGENWTDFKIVNDEVYTVKGGYRTTDMIDMDRIVWTDYRNANDDIYYYLGYTPKPDLKIINFTLTKELPIPFAHNMISIAVNNHGDGTAENIQIQIKYQCKEENETTLYTEYIPILNGGDNRTYLYTLFPFKKPDYREAYKKFAGIQTITVIIDSDNQYEAESSGSFNDNVLTKTIEYKDIFPLIGRFKIIEAFFIISKKLD